jgi:two-component system OmpR family sensor kinase
VRPTHQSLSQRLTRPLIALFAISWLVVTLASAVQIRTEINEGLDHSLVEGGQRLLELALIEPSPLLSGHLEGNSPAHIMGHVKSSGFDDDHVSFQVVNGEHKVLLRSEDAPEAAFMAPLRNGFSEQGDWRIYTYGSPTHPVHIHIADSLAHRNRAVLESVLWLLLPMLGVLPLLAWLALRIIRRELAPVGRLADQINQRNGQDLSPLSSASLPNELKVIADTTNHLMKRLSDALDIERALAANAAHEIRTPLATMRLRLHHLLGMELPPLVETEIANTLDSLVQINQRAEKLLQLSRAESGSWLGSDAINLVRLAGIVAQEFWADPSLAGRVRLHVPQDHDVMALGDFDALAIVLRNLIENAVRHGGAGPIDVTVSAPACIRVCDQGPGLPPDKLALIRLRHVRHTDQSTGYGLGMSIVSTILERHHATLTLNSPPTGQNRGLEAIIMLRPAIAGTEMPSARDPHDRPPT